MEDNKVTVRIYGQEYTISGERDPETIQEIAAYVDEKMKEISKFTASNKAGALATLACVNMADEVFSMREELEGLRQEKEQLEKVRAKMRREGSIGQTIGLNNVYQRLRIFYGDQMEMELFSEAGKGTTVCIRIPYRPDQQMKDSAAEGVV